MDDNQVFLNIKFQNWKRDRKLGSSTRIEINFDFVTPDEESKILDTLNWNNDEYSGHLKHRKVQHFGYEFCYDTNRVDVDKPIAPIPEELNFISGSIPPHIDTHSVFEDPILSLSLGATYVMDFRKDNKKVSLALPARSLLIMSGESRYAWTHVRRGNCQCNYPQYCVSKNYVNEEIDNYVAPGLENSYVHKIGCDRSSGLLDISVIHHLSTPDRRRNAFIEILRVLRPGGKCLIYVWAKEQRRDSKDSTYLRFNSKKTNDNHSTDVKKIFDNLTLNIHENRTNFRHSDVLVPWKRKGGGEYLRYYHVFEESEFIKLCQNLPNSKVEKIFYDQGNWCTILEKI
ncbi:hypothetical protein HCN44_011503 [Aphidius gifuensis]|uniref:Alpha-ketoglutarate-dependent dioxygenase AlkB-like domain-containing protein n=1 Tax=Aphidius gifuensis TaxID=684658 RepID=A0A834XI14_APHGI|nr:hypothetical protein HCN44_011503 [Aphidius gifuensis]